MNKLIEFLPGIRDVIQSFWSEILVVITLFLFRLVGIDLFRKLVWWGHFLWMVAIRISGKRVLFLYTDCDDSNNTNLGLKTCLDPALPQAHVVILNNPEQILNWPSFLWLTHSYFLIITDVTPLSSDELKRIQIQKKLEKFVHAGGTLVLGHDALYRRSKSRLMQKLAGCKITGFVRQDEKPVAYRLFSDQTSPRYGRSLVSDLAINLQFEDREYIKGEWASDVKFIYVLGGDNEDAMELQPLVTCRVIGRGNVIWFNSGDSTELGPPEPLASPNPDFIRMITIIVSNAQRRARPQTVAPVPVSLS